MHPIFHTTGFILGHEDRGEASRFISIFTKDFGLIRALAQGVREQKAKLKFSLQDFSWTHLDLVMGREFWRITSASRIDFLLWLPEKELIFDLITKITLVVKRFCQGEEKNEGIYNLLEILFLFLEKEKDIITEIEIKNLEIFFVWRILFQLGYIGDKNTLAFSAVYQKDFFTIDGKLLLLIASHRRELIKEINQAFQESHL